MINQTLRNKVVRMIAREDGDDAVLDLITGEIAFRPQHQAILDRFSAKHSLPCVTATDNGRAYMLQAITDSTSGNEEEFALLMQLHEVLEERSQWMLTESEEANYLKLGGRRQSGRTLSLQHETRFQRLHSRLATSGVVKLDWTASGDGEIVVLPCGVENRAMGVVIGDAVPEDLKKQIADAVVRAVAANYR